MFLFPLAGCLLLLFAPRAEARDRLGDKIVFKDYQLLAYIPAYPLQRNGDALYHPHVRTPHFDLVDETKFHVSWNPVRCTEGKDENDYHTIVLSFLEDWVPEADIPAAQVLKNALVFTFLGRSVKKTITATLSQMYKVKTFEGGKETGSESDLEVTMNNAGFYVSIVHGWMHMGVFRHGDYDRFNFQATIKIPKNATVMALLANQQYECPVFISAVDRNFPTWLPEYGVANYTQGIKKKEPTSPILLTSLILSLFVVALFTCLAWLGFFEQWNASMTEQKSQEVAEPSIKDLMTTHVSAKSSESKKEKITPKTSLRSPS